MQFFSTRLLITGTGGTLYLRTPTICAFILCRKKTGVADPDPGSGAILTPGSGIRDGTKSGIGDEHPSNFSVSLEGVFTFRIKDA
jgi:hypothetical protein